LRKVNWGDLGRILSQLDFRWAFAGWLLTLGMILLLALRWQLFLAQQRLEVPFGRLFVLTWAGQFFNSILPGSTGGDVVKIYQLCRMAPERKAAAAASVFADRLSALLALLLLVTIGFALEPAPLRLLLRERLGGQWTILCVAIVLIAVAGLVLWRLLRSPLWVARIQRLIAAVKECFRWNRKLGFALVLAFVLHWLNFSIVFAFARSLGIGITYGQVLFMMPVILFLVMIPITINGHGLREWLFIGYFVSMGVTIIGHPEIRVQDTVVALSVVVVANDLMWSLPGGVWYLLVFRAPPTSAK
jgi:glycosyltransferase 2 family protein